MPERTRARLTGGDRDEATAAGLKTEIKQQAIQKLPLL